MDKKKEKGPGSHFWIARALEPKKKKPKHASLEHPTCVGLF